MNEELLNKLVLALEFYANGEHEQVIYNHTACNEARDSLTDKGFSFQSEAYNGDEYYVEDGRTAREALAELKKYIEDNDERTNS
jgi:hypothetical protein